MSRIQAFAPQHLNLDLGPMAATASNLTNLNDPASILKAYQGSHSASLGMNSQVVQNRQRLGEQLQGDAARAGEGVLDAYNRVTQGGEALRTDAATQNADIARQYGQLSTDVLGDIKGIEESRLTDINTQYARDSSDMQQNLISRGLGNTTVRDSLDRGLQSDRDRSRTRLANEIADLTAGYRSNLGLAGLADTRRGQEQGIGLGRENLSYQTQAAREQARQGDIQTGLGQDFLRFVESFQVPYPDAAPYFSLAQQFGSAQQAGADRAQLMGAFGAMQAAAGKAGGAGTLEAAVPTSGGGFMGGTGRSLSGPEANYGGSVMYGAGPGSAGYGATSMVAPASYTPSVPALSGAGGGYGPAGMTWDQSTGSIDYSGGFSPEVAAGGYGMSGGDLNYGLQSSGDLFLDDEYADDFGGYGFDGGGFFG